MGALESRCLGCGFKRVVRISVIQRMISSPKWGQCVPARAERWGLGDGEWLAAPESEAEARVAREEHGRLQGTRDW